MTAYPIGGLFEITTDHGLVYAQYTHEVQKYGSLLRILPDFYEKEPRDLASLVAGPTRQVCFANLPYYVRSGRFRPVGEQQVPKHARSFPLFNGSAQSSGASSRTGIVLMGDEVDSNSRTPLSAN